MRESAFWRPLAQTDRDAVFAMTSDPQVARFMRFDTHTVPEQAEELIRAYTAPGNLAFLVLDRETGEAAGVAALKQSGEPGVLDLSLFFGKRFWGKGYSTLAVQKLLQLAKGEKAQRILGYVVEENTGSRRVLEKCGFCVDHVLHFGDTPSGLYVYAVDLDGEMKETKG